MNATHPPGFCWHSIGYHNGKLLLPKTLVKQLAEKAELDTEQDFLQAEIDETIKQLLAHGNLSLPQLHEHLVAFAQEPRQKATTKPVKSQNTNDKYKYVKVFEIEKIRTLKHDKATTRNVLAVMKRFGDDDTGERILKTVPKNFMREMRTLKTQYPNCWSFLDYVESFAMLALKQPHSTFYFPPVLLVGEPGIGKTAVVNAVAEIVGVTSRQVDLAATTAGFVLGGMSTQWSDAKSGAIVELLRDHDAANPIVILDEIDKASSSSKYDPLGPLYSLLEQKTAEKFIDEAMDMPANASHLLYVATANSLATISKPILSRFIVLQIDAMSAEQHGDVTQSIYSGLLIQHSATKLFPVRVSDGVIEALRNQSPRTIKTMLRCALAQAAKRNPKARKLALMRDDLIFSSTTGLSAGEYDGRPFGYVH
ncbi:MAG: AAA family ATPase [Methylobacter sp.]|nr:AAA family ATPase [Methylobacter sp.]